MAEKKITEWTEILVTPCYVDSDGKEVKLSDQTLPIVKEELKNDADVVLVRADCDFKLSFMFTRYEGSYMYLRSIDNFGTNQIRLRFGEVEKTPALSVDGKNIFFEFSVK